MINLESITETEETRRGELLAKLLNLKESKFEDANGKHRYDPPRYSTEHGTKTALGLFRTVARLVIDGE